MGPQERKTILHVFLMEKWSNMTHLLAFSRLYFFDILRPFSFFIFASHGFTIHHKLWRSVVDRQALAGGDAPFYDILPFEENGHIASNLV
jgi:hypothetical protein